jgi:hypothetical protein
MTPTGLKRGMGPTIAHHSVASEFWPAPTWESSGVTSPRLPYTQLATEKLTGARRMPDDGGVRGLLAIPAAPRLGSFVASASP